MSTTCSWQSPFQQPENFLQRISQHQTFSSITTKKLDQKNQDNKHNIDRQLYQNKLIINEANKNARNLGEKYREGKLVQISGWRSQPQAHGASSPQNLQNFLHLSVGNRYSPPNSKTCFTFLRGEMKVTTDVRITQAFSREFKDWHLQWGNGF